jgi:osmoprotectant transport system permease protein
MTFVIRLAVFLGVGLFNYGAFAVEKTNVVKVGSKVYTESVILGEITNLLLKQSEIRSQHIRELGGTRILWNSLLAGEIDVYPEFTGTITHELFPEKNISSFDELQSALAEKGLAIAGPIGFNNTYAIGMKAMRARELGIYKISDLLRHPNLKFGFSSEFLERKEGWPGLQNRYDLSQTAVKGMSHDIAYRALDSGAVDIVDLYSTDAEITYYDLTVLDDDRDFFPRYDAMLLYRLDLTKSNPEILSIFESLKNRINEAEMIKLNGRVKNDRIPESLVASEFINKTFGISTKVATNSMFSKLLTYTWEHLQLVFVSLLGAILIAIPLGIFAAKLPKFGKVIMSVVGIVQTIPSLALLVFMIPLVGIGTTPVILALFLYSILPIVRNTFQGLIDMPQSLRESAIVLGLPNTARLLRIELPFAMSYILAGIKTSAVINIGTATIGALVGAGGYGQPILTGIRLDNMQLILLGAVPAAVLAMITQYGFDKLEERLKLVYSRVP